MRCLNKNKNRGNKKLNNISIYQNNNKKKCKKKLINTSNKLMIMIMIMNKVDFLKI